MVTRASTRRCRCCDPAQRWSACSEISAAVSSVNEFHCLGVANGCAGDSADGGLTRPEFESLLLSDGANFRGLVEAYCLDPANADAMLRMQEMLEAKRRADEGRRAGEGRRAAGEGQRAKDGGRRRVRSIPEPVFREQSYKTGNGSPTSVFRTPWCRSEEAGAGAWMPAHEKDAATIWKSVGLWASGSISGVSLRGPDGRPYPPRRGQLPPLPRPPGVDSLSASGLLKVRATTKEMTCR